MLNIHTLGPTGTNCERAAKEYLHRTGRDGKINLHSTLEGAVDEMLKLDEVESVLLGCVVYPNLHEIVFRNLGKLTMVECFVMDTYEMVFASTKEWLEEVSTVCTHPAPAYLVGLVSGLHPNSVVHSDSNAEASRLCAGGAYDGCITTLAAAEANKLVVHKNFGPVPMGFSIHRKEGHP